MTPTLDVETVIRCYAFVAKWHRDHCDHMFHGAPPPAISASMGETTRARRAMAAILAEALTYDEEHHSKGTPLIDAASDNLYALHAMWGVSPDDRDSAKSEHRASEAALLKAVCA